MSFEQATQDQLHPYVTRFCDTVQAGLGFLEQSLGDYHAKMAWDKEEDEAVVIFKYNKTKITKKKQAILPKRNKMIFIACCWIQKV